MFINCSLSKQNKWFSDTSWQRGQREDFNVIWFWLASEKFYIRKHYYPLVPLTCPSLILQYHWAVDYSYSSMDGVDLLSSLQCLVCLSPAVVDFSVSLHIKNCVSSILQFPFSFSFFFKFSFLYIFRFSHHNSFSVSFLLFNFNFNYHNNILKPNSTICSTKSIKKKQHLIF